MAGRAEGKVVFITGAGRGQGRSHAVRLAEEGADIIAVDVLGDYPTLDYAMSTRDDLDETVRLVKATGRRIVAGQADVRDLDALKEVVDAGVAELGHLDAACANAGICTMQPWDQVTKEVWRDTLDTNLTGVWNTMVATVPHLIANGGGSIVCTGSSAGYKSCPFLAPYVAAKHGIVGIAKGMANELAGRNIRVNVVNPTGVNTPMIGVGSILGDINDDPKVAAMFLNALDVDAVDVRDISNAVLYLVSDESRYVTGLVMDVDAGHALR